MGRHSGHILKPTCTEICPGTLPPIQTFELYRVECGFDPKDWEPMTHVAAGVKEIRVRDEAGGFRMNCESPSRFALGLAEILGKHIAE